MKDLTDTKTEVEVIKTDLQGTSYIGEVTIFKWINYKWVL